MKTKFALLDTTESRNISGFITIIFLLSIFTDLKLSLVGYIIALLLFMMSKTEMMEKVQDDSSIIYHGDHKDIIVLKRIYLRNNKNLDRKLFYFNRFFAFLFPTGVIIHDILVNLKIIDPT